MIRRGLNFVKGLGGRALRLKNRMEEHFIEKQFIASIRPTDTFMVSYPKSGSTWICFMIAHLLRGENKEELQLRDVELYTPVISKFYKGCLEDFGKVPDPRVFQARVPTDHPSFNNILYVIRDPRDVMVSYWHYHKVLLPDFDKPINEFIMTNNHWPCHWHEHVENWLSRNPSRRKLVVRFEDLKKDTISGMKKIVEFTGIRCTAADIERAEEMARFDKMRASEEKFGMHSSGQELPNYSKEERFCRRGKVGGWRDELSDECVKFINEKYGKVMREYGYETGGK